MRPTTPCSGNRRPFLALSFEIYFFWGLERCPKGNAENNILKQHLTINKVMSFSDLFFSNDPQCGPRA